MTGTLAWFGLPSAPVAVSILHYTRFVAYQLAPWLASPRLDLGPPTTLGLCTLGPPRGPSTTCYPRGGLSLEPLGLQSLLALASQTCLQPLLALCLVSMVSTVSRSQRSPRTFSYNDRLFDSYLRVDVRDEFDDSDVPTAFSATRPR